MRLKGVGDANFPNGNDADCGLPPLGHENKPPIRQECREMSGTSCGVKEVRRRKNTLFDAIWTEL